MKRNYNPPALSQLCPECGRKVFTRRGLFLPPTRKERTCQKSTLSWEWQKGFQSMSEPRKFPPRQGDLPLDDLVALAEKTIKDAGGKDNCIIYFKFTCAYCGARIQFSEPYTCYRKGECADCGKVTDVEVGGLVAHFPMRRPNVKNN